MRVVGNVDGDDADASSDDEDEDDDELAGFDNGDDDSGDEHGEEDATGNGNLGQEGGRSMCPDCFNVSLFRTRGDNEIEG